MKRELVNYLPFNLNGIYKNKICKLDYIDFGCGYWEELGVSVNGVRSYISELEFKPILRPISDLTEKEEWKRKLLSFLSNGKSDEYNNPITIHTKNKHLTFKIKMYTYIGLNNRELFEYTVYKNLDRTITKYNLIEWALTNHFDVYGLIGNGLAVDINTI